MNYTNIIATCILDRHTTFRYTYLIIKTVILLYAQRINTFH